MVYGLKPLNRSMTISKNLFLKIFLLISIFCQNIIGQDLFQLNIEYSSVLQNIITSDIEIADLNNDGKIDAQDLAIAQAKGLEILQFGVPSVGGFGTGFALGLRHG